MSYIDYMQNDDLNDRLAEGLKMTSRGELCLAWKDRAFPGMPSGDFFEFMLVAGLQGQQAATGQTVPELIAGIFYDPEHQEAVLQALISGRFIDADHQFTEKAREYL